jgi:hypothetical protein
VGDWKGCIETLEKKQTGDLAREFILAMAYWHEGNKPAARAHFDRGNKRLAEYEKQDHGRTMRWYAVEPYKRLQSEAETLLRSSTANSAISRTPIYAERPGKQKSAGVATGR